MSPDSCLATEKSVEDMLTILVESLHLNVRELSTSGTGRRNKAKLLGTVDRYLTPLQAVTISRETV